MKIIRKKNNLSVLRLEAGEEFLASLERFVKQEKIYGAWFWAIGACDDVTLAFYDWKNSAKGGSASGGKKYISRRFRGRIEIVNITGNIATCDVPQGYRKSKDRGRQIIIHAHGTFSKPNYQTIGGHIMRCVISVTCEIYFAKLPALKRKRDPKTGLHLLTS